MSKRFVVVAALASTSASCSGSGGGGGSSEAQISSVSPLVGTEPPLPAIQPTSTIGVADSTTTTTEAVETTLSVVPTTTSTTDPAQTEAERDAEIVAAVEAYAESWRECLRQLPACDTSALADHRTGERLDLAITLAQEWNALGYRAENVGSLTFRIDAVRFFDRASDVEVEICESDGVVLKQGDELVDDRYVSAIAYLQLLEQDGSWKVFRSTDHALASGIENDLCV